MSEASRDVSDAVQAYIEANDGFLSRIGCRVTRLDREGCVVSVGDAAEVRSANTTGTVAAHGGAVATLVDTAGGLALRPHLDDPLRDTVVTASLNVDYHEAATEDVVARGEVERLGRSLGFSRVEVRSAGDVVATGSGCFKVLGGDR